MSGLECHICFATIDSRGKLRRGKVNGVARGGLHSTGLAHHWYHKGSRSLAARPSHKPRHGYQVSDQDLILKIMHYQLMNKADRTSQVRQCLGFCTADFLSLLAYESAEQKPKHCLTWDFLSALLIIGVVFLYLIITVCIPPSRHYDSVRMERDQRFFEKPVMETVGGNLRVRFCLQTNELMCGPYTEALIVDVR